MAYVLCVRACVWELWVLVHVPDLCLRVRLKGDVRQSTLCMGAHGLPQVSSFLLCLWICLVRSCPVFVLVLVFLGGSELVCVFVLGEGRVSVWGWGGCFNKSLGMMSCSSLCTALWCINLHSVPAWLYFFILHSYRGSPLLGSLWWLFSQAGCSCWALSTFCLFFFLPNFAGSWLLLHFDRPITALRSGGF